MTKMLYSRTKSLVVDDDMRNVYPITRILEKVAIEVNVMIVFEKRPSITVIQIDEFTG